MTCALRKPAQGKGCVLKHLACEEGFIDLAASFGMKVWIKFDMMIARMCRAIPAAVEKDALRDPVSIGSDIVGFGEAAAAQKAHEHFLDKVIHLMRIGNPATEESDKERPQLSVGTMIRRDVYGDGAGG